MLEQEVEKGVRVPIAYASRAMNAAEKKYRVTEVEVAALVYSIEHFEVYFGVYLLDNSVTVFTDHKALVQLYIPYLKSQPKALLVSAIASFSPHT